MPPIPDSAAGASEAVAQQQEDSFTRSMRELADTLKQSATTNPSLDRPLIATNSQVSRPRVVLHLIRHAEVSLQAMAQDVKGIFSTNGSLADHNLAHLYGLDRASYPDPVLTPHGLDQCQQVLRTFPHMGNVTLVLCSPLRRTMQTALFSFQPVYTRGVKLMLWPALREWGNGASNIGYPVHEMEKEMANLPVDLRLLNEGWELEQDLKIDGAERSNRVRRDLYALGDTLLQGGVWKSILLEKQSGPIHILVVSHGGFLSNVMQTHVGSCLRNARHKSFVFASEEQIGGGASKYRLFEISKAPKPPQSSKRGRSLE